MQPTTNSRHPLDSLPVEVVSRILEQAFYSCDRSERSIQRFRFPKTLCHVSRFFYQIAMSTPVLWSYLYLSLRSDPAHIKDRIERKSGRVLLDIFVTLDAMDGWRGANILEMVGSCADRWRHLYVTLWDKWAPKSTLDKLQGVLSLPAPHLQDLHLSVRGGYGDQHPPLLPSGTSTVRSLRLHECNFSWAALLPIPESLTELAITNSGNNLGDASPIEIAAAFNASGMLSRSLRSLTLAQMSITLGDDDDPFGENRTPLPTCCLESLEFLELLGFTQTETIVLFTVIQTPLVRHLSLELVSEGEETGPDAEPEARERALRIQDRWESFRFPTLQEVTFGYMNIPEKALVFFLANLPESVRRFNLLPWRDQGSNPLTGSYNSPYTKPFLHQLEAFSASGLPLDQLHHLVKCTLRGLRVLEVDAKDVEWEVVGSVERRDLVMKSMEEVVEVKLINYPDGATGPYRKSLQYEHYGC